MLFVRQFRILPLVNVPKVRYFWILMNFFRIYYLFTNFFCLHFSQGPVSSIVHMWPVSQQTWTCQQSAVWETATVPLVCHVKIGNAGLQRRAPVPEKGYGDWLMEVTCADPYISSLVLRGGVLRLSELPHLPYFYPLSSSSLRLLKNPKSAVNFTNSERPFNFAQVNHQISWNWLMPHLISRVFWWWKVWFILLNSGTLFWFLLFYIMFT